MAGCFLLSENLRAHDSIQDHERSRRKGRKLAAKAVSPLGNLGGLLLTLNPSSAFVPSSIFVHPPMVNHVGATRSGPLRAATFQRPQRTGGYNAVSMSNSPGDILESLIQSLPTFRNPFDSEAEFAEYAAKTPIVILPGFGNDAKDYISPLGEEQETGMVAALNKRGFVNVQVLPVQRLEWARVIGGLLDGAWYSGEQSPYGNAYGWYISRARAEIKAASEKSGTKVVLVGHSAGGWLARAILGDGTTPWDEESSSAGQDYVSTLVTLGAPHFPPPDSSKCATRGALSFVSDQFPGAFLASKGIQYITVAGDSVTGMDVAAAKATEDNAELDDLYTRRGEGSAQRVAFVNYEAVSGDGTLSGDGVIPLKAAHLQGARQITIAGVRHSFNEAGTAQLAKSWYGSDEVVAEWLKAIDVNRKR